jgi:hypothetical protein
MIFLSRRVFNILVTVFKELPFIVTLMIIENLNICISDVYLAQQVPTDLGTFHIDLMSFNVKISTNSKWLSGDLTTA